LADSCESCAADYRFETLGLDGVCYPIEVEAEFNKWKTTYSSDLNVLIKKKSHKRK